MPKTKSALSRKTKNTRKVAALRSAESTEQRNERLLSNRMRQRLNYTTQNADIIRFRSAFEYDASKNYEMCRILSIGKMNKVCNFCQAKKWENETIGMCCANGKVRLPELSTLPSPLNELVFGNHPSSKHFLENVRKYNVLFQMTSFGAKIMREDNYMPTFKVQGQVYHRIGSLLPINNSTPQFLQIYFVSEADQLTIRSNIIPDLKQHIISLIQSVLLQSNPYIRSLKCAIGNFDSQNLKLVIHSDRKPVNQHPGRYNLPVVNEVAVVMVNEENGPRDIILRTHSNELQRISEVHRSYDALQYPLIFVHGEDGYSIDVPQVGNSTKTVSCANFYAYRIMVRECSTNQLLHFRQLFNQYIVDMVAKIISERLLFIKNNQRSLRAENYIHLRDSIQQDINPQEIGQMVILPSTFTGSPRYLHEKTQDALCYVRQFGRPDLFITFTTNPEWTEIKEELFQNQIPAHRHDIVARVFHLKVNKLMDVITKKKIFGTVLCHMYTVEWQKRGLPHVHILIWLQEKVTPNDINFLISAELPDQTQDPHLFECIKTNMIHGPCGEYNPNAPCMVEGRCTKRYPKEFCSETQTDQDGYPKYRRRSPQNGGYTFVKNIHTGPIEIDNKWVVPYCPILSRCFKAHINVEYCHSVQAIRYICKYINKGSDQVTFSVEGSRNEIQNYLNGRYISSSEAIWRIFAFPIHDHFPPVVHLAVHLENGQRVYFNPQNVNQVLENPPTTTLLEFFKLCTTDEFAKTLLYCDVPKYYTWNQKTWCRRKRGDIVDGFPGIRKSPTIGRVFTIHPNFSECFYLRLLLHNVRGPTSFTFLKTVGGIEKATFQEACKERNLLENDSHWENALFDASISCSSNQLRELFAIMLVFCQLSDAMKLWGIFKMKFCEDILYRKQVLENDTTLPFSDEIYNEGLLLLESNISNFSDRKLADFGLPQPIYADLPAINQTSILNDNIALQAQIAQNISTLNTEQLQVYNEVLKSIFSNDGKIFFLDAPGGTGKTYLLNLILAKVQLENKNPLAVSSSGIAATLLRRGKTAHSLFKLPLNLKIHESSTCPLKKNSLVGNILQKCSLIIWDECTMSHRVHIEAVDRTLRDIRSSNKVMGGLTFIFSGDFRQTLPVISKGTRADTVNACLIASPLWHHINVLKLTVNMRIQLNNNTNGCRFAEALLHLGKGSFPQSDGLIEIDQRFGNIVDTLDELVLNIYPDVQNIASHPNEWICNRIIVAPTNNLVEEINEFILKKFDSLEREYKSIDTVVEQEDSIHFPTEFLNSLNPSGLPSHRLLVKVGSPLILLRNLKPPHLCNGTRLRAIQLFPNVIKVIILSGPAFGQEAIIPRIPMIPSDLPIQFKRLQFPLKVCFAITINKAQGQTFKFVGVDLRENCFSHGQLYVALSRIGNSDNQYLLLNESKKTKNVVFQEVFNY